MELTLLIQPSRAEEEYSLGFTDKDNYTLIYEYSIVDEDKLKYLYVQTGDEMYEDLAKISEGDRVKIAIAKIEESSDYWEITSTIYSGKNLNERGKDLISRAYKDPSDLKEEVFEESENEVSFLHFVPINIEEYLKEFIDSVTNDERYIEADYLLLYDEMQFEFDYTSNGYSDKIVQEFDEDGILISLIIFCDDKEAFKYEFKKAYEDYGTIIFTIIVIVISVSAIGILIFYIYYKKQNRTLKEPESKVDKLIKKIK